MTQHETNSRDRTFSAISDLFIRLTVCSGRVRVWSVEDDFEKDSTLTKKKLADELFEIAVVAQDASKAIIESQDQDNGTSKA